MSDSTPRHPIRVVALRTGLTPSTLRAWERRYHVVDPGRSDGGQRLYSDDDVERLSLLRALTDNGRSIGAVAELSDDEARGLLEEDALASASVPSRPSVPEREITVWVDEAYAAILRLDGKALEAALRRAAFALGGSEFLDEVVAPLLVRIGEGWAAGDVSPAQEHLGSDVLEGVLHWLTTGTTTSAGASRILVATLPGERHGLGARLVAAAAVGEGWAATYLGVDLPVRDIAAAARDVGADQVAISLVSNEDRGRAVEQIALLRDALPSSTGLILGGRGSSDLSPSGLPSGVVVADGLEGLRRELREAAAASA